MPCEWMSQKLLNLLHETLICSAVCGCTSVNLIFSPCKSQVYCLLVNVMSIVLTIRCKQFIFPCIGCFGNCTGLTISYLKLKQNIKFSLSRKAGFVSNDSIWLLCSDNTDSVISHSTSVLHTEYLLYQAHT